MQKRSEEKLRSADILYFSVKTAAIYINIIHIHSSLLLSVVNRVVGSFLSYVNIVGVGLLKTCTCNPYKLCSFVEIGDSGAAAVAHTGTDTANKLEYSVGNKSLVRNTTLNALGNELLCALLEISVLGAASHSAQ